jgi:predicted AAA+ superfamily ATPase
MRRRKGYDKICLCDPALRASWLQEKVPLRPDELEQMPSLADLAGHLAESVTGYFLDSLPGVAVHHFPARETEPEVDFILTVGDKRIPLEVKYQGQIRDEDTVGIRSFLEKTVYHATFGILVTRTDDVKIRDPRIIAMPLSSLLLLK